MDWVRPVVAAATGAAIGVVVVMALSWSLRLLARPSAGFVQEEPENWPRAKTLDVPRSPPYLTWAAKAAIILLAAAGYGLVGYGNRPAVVPLPAAPMPDMQAAAELHSGAEQINVGAVTLVFDPPAGYCVYPPGLMRSVVAQQEKLNPDNVVHIAFGNCDELRAAKENPGRIRDFGLLMTPKAQLGQDFGPAQLDRIASDTVDFGTLKETLDQRLRESGTRLTVQSFAPLGRIDRDDRSIYFAFLTKTDDANIIYRKACVMAVTALKGRMLSYYLYSHYDTDARSSVFGLLQSVKSGVDRLMQRNG